METEQHPTTSPKSQNVPIQLTITSPVHSIALNGEGEDAKIAQLASFIAALTQTQRIHKNTKETEDDFAVKTPLHTLGGEEGQKTRRLEPILLKGHVGDWRALREWRDLGFLKRKFGRRRVPVEIGSSYAGTDYSQQLMRLCDFIDACNKTEAEDGEAGRQKLYLAQHRLLDQIPQLSDDLETPDAVFAALEILHGQAEETREEKQEGISDEDESQKGFLEKEEEEEKNHGCSPDEVERNAWVGPAGTVSPLHVDPRENVFCQVVGSKYVRLYAPEESKSLYPYEGGFLTNTSQITQDISPGNDQVDEERFPKFGGAPYVEAVVSPGDCLFIPRGWWHFVKSLEPSFSVSFWFG